MFDRRVVVLMVVSSFLLGLLVAREWNRRGQPGQARLVVQDPARKGRAVLTPQGLVLEDSLGKPRATVGVDENDNPRVALANRDGLAQVELQLFADAPRLRLVSAEGGDVFAVATQADGSLRLELADASGRPRAALSTDAAGEPSLALSDRHGSRRVLLAVTDREASLLLESRNATFRAPVP